MLPFEEKETKKNAHLSLCGEIKSFDDGVGNLEESGDAV